MFRSRARILTCLFGGVAALAAGVPASAQFAPSIPYTPYTSQYQSFSYPTIVNPAIPNQARFKLYDQSTMGQVSLDTPVDAMGGMVNNRMGASLSAGRADTTMGKAEADYTNDVQLRETLYDEWTKEHDPARRAELAKQLQDVNARLRTATESRRRGTGGGSATRRKPSSAAGADASTPGIDPVSNVGSLRRTGAAPKPARTAGPGTNTPKPGAGAAAGAGAGSRPGAGRSTSAPVNPARPNATSNRVGSTSAPTNPVHPQAANRNTNASQPNNGRATTKPRNNQGRLTPEEIMERSRRLDAERAASGAFEPGPSRFGSTGTDRSSTIRRSRFGTGQPANGSGNARPRQ